MIATGAAFGLLGAGTALAKYDPKFRTGVEDAIPIQIRYSMPYWVRDRSSRCQASSEVGSIARHPEAGDTAASLLQKKLDRESKIQPLPAKPATSSSLPAVPAPLLEKPAEAAKPPIVPVPTAVKTVASTPTPDESRVQPEGGEGVNPKSGISPRPAELPAPVPVSSSKTDNDFDLNSLPDKVREKVKQEMTEQLKLQLSAYNDYLHDQLQLQQAELSRMHVIEMEERVLEEKMRYQRELAGSIVRLQDVEQVLQGDYCFCILIFDLTLLFSIQFSPGSSGS